MPTNRYNELAIVKEISRRKEVEESLDWDELLFDKQRTFVKDPSRLKVACCSRRAGKSHGVAMMLLKSAIENPGSTPVYINMNRASAQLIIWPALRALDNELKLGLQFIRSSGDIQVPSANSEIKVFGAGSMREMDKVRGVGATLTMACLDEAQNFGADMEYLIRNVILPATADHKAPVVVTGTPNQTCSGPFYEICNAEGDLVEALAEKGFGWSVHNWTMHDNPNITETEEEYQLALAANRWNENTPAYRREYWGEWVRDTEGLCFEIYDDHLVEQFDESIAADWRYVLGVDIGTRDPCAFTVMAFSEEAAVCYVLQSYREQLDTLEAGDEIEKLMQVYPIEVAVVDAGGMGARDVQLWDKTHPHLPVMRAKKGPGSVDMGISILNADMRAGKIKIVKQTCGQLLDEMRLLSWDEDLRMLGRRQVRKGDPDHCADSYRYGYQKVYTYDAYKGARLPDPDTYVDRMMKKIKEQALKPRRDDGRPRWLGIPLDFLGRE